MVQDKAEAAAATLGGDFRTGAGLAAGGMLLLASTLTEIWPGAAVVPGALAVSLLVSGGYLLSLRAGLPALVGGGRAATIRCFDGHGEPVLLTDLEGRVLGANPAARRTRAGEGLATGAARYRLTREARTNGVAIEEAEHGGRLVVTRIGPRSLLWRLEGAGPAAPAIPSFGDSGLPWLRVDAEGRVLEQNAAAAAIAAGRADLDEILGDGPLRPDGVHVLAATGQAVRAVAFPGGDGWHDLLLMPLNGAEISGLVPDHFLEELPVALARIETGGRLTYANKAARQLLGERAQPGADIADLIEGLARPIAERPAARG